MVQHWLSGLQLSFMEVKYSFGLLKTDLKSFPPSQLRSSVLEDELAKKKKTPKKTPTDWNWIHSML